MVQSELSSDDILVMLTSSVLELSGTVPFEVVCCLSGLLLISGKSGSPSVVQKLLLEM